MVEAIKGKITESTDKKIIKKLEKAENMLKDKKIEEIQSSVDEDAKQGYKSENNDFFGYKNHVAMTRERIVTALEITSGEAPDGKYLPELVKKSKLVVNITGNLKKKATDIEMEEWNMNLTKKYVPNALEKMNV